MLSKLLVFNGLLVFLGCLFLVDTLIKNGNVTPLSTSPKANLATRTASYCDSIYAPPWVTAKNDSNGVYLSYFNVFVGSSHTTANLTDEQPPLTAEFPGSYNPCEAAAACADAAINSPTLNGTQDLFFDVHFLQTNSTWECFHYPFRYDRQFDQFNKGVGMAYGYYYEVKNVSYMGAPPNP